MAPLRKNITLSKAALKQAAELKAKAYASTRSGVIARAVNEAWEGRFGATLKKPPAAPSRAVPHGARPKSGASSKRSQPSGKPYDPALKSSRENPSS